MHMKKKFNPLFYLLGYLIYTLKIPVKQGGFKIRFPINMTRVELGWSLLNRYEINERKLVQKFIHSSDRVLELGACIGVVSLTVNKILSEKDKQVSVEPNPEMHYYLEWNRRINNGQFSIEKCIISNQPKNEFFIGGRTFMSSSTFGKGEKILVQGKTLKELIHKYFDFSVIVMDIEGGELDFFRSFNLKNSKIRLIIWEEHYHNGNGMLNKPEIEECYKLLKSYGFVLLEKAKDVEVWARRTYLIKNTM